MIGYVVLLDVLYLQALRLVDLIWVPKDEQGIPLYVPLIENITSSGVSEESFKIAVSVFEPTVMLPIDIFIL